MTKIFETEEEVQEVQVEISFGELFEKFEKLNDMKFSDKTDDEYLLESDEIFQVKNEHDEWINVTGLVTKFDELMQMDFESGKELKAAKNHLISYDGLHTKFLHEYQVGEQIKKADGAIEIVSNIKKINSREKLYDIQVASDTHLYQTADKMIHHNSVGLVNLAWNYIQMKRDVVYISLELKEEKIMKRYITHSTKIPNHKIPESEMEIYNHLKKCEQKGYGRFTVHFYQPNTLSAMKLELFIRNYIQKYNTVPIIILDYAGLMTPNGKNWNGLFEKDKYISEELRAVGTQFNTVVWSADQYNRCISLGEQVMTPNGKKNIEDLKVQDKVLGSNNEWRTVLAVTEPEEQEVYEITTKSGKKIKVSARHLFPKFMEDGKIIEDCIMASLKVGDKLMVYQDEEEVSHV